MNNRNMKNLILLLVVIFVITLLLSCRCEWNEYDSKPQKDMNEYRQIIDPMCETNGYTVKERNTHSNLYYCSAVDNNGINVQITVYAGDEDSDDIGIAVIYSSTGNEEICNKIKDSYSLVIPLINRFSETEINSDIIDLFIEDSSNQIKDSDEENLIMKKHMDKGDFYLEYELYCEDDDAGDECINNHSVTGVLYIATKYDEY